jgi:hypothetical protein
MDRLEEIKAVTRYDNWHTYLRKDQLDWLIAQLDTIQKEADHLRTLYEASQRALGTVMAENRMHQEEAERLRAALEDERQACARICDRHSDYPPPGDVDYVEEAYQCAARAIAVEIRSRGRQ